MPRPEYHHVVDPYASHSGVSQFAASLQLLKDASRAPDVALASPGALAAVVAQPSLSPDAGSDSGVTADSSSAPDMTVAYAFFSLLLILLVLQGIVWIAQKLYLSSIQAKKFDRSGGGKRDETRELTERGSMVRSSESHHRCFCCHAQFCATSPSSHPRLPHLRGLPSDSDSFWAW